MNKGFYISATQFSTLVFFFTIGSSILLTPSVLVSAAKQQGWIAGVIALGIGLLLALLYGGIGSKQQAISFVDYVQSVYGKWIGTLILLHYFFFFMILCALVLRDMGDFMTAQILSETPIISVHIVYMLLVIYATSLGILSLSRFSQVLFPGFLILILSLVLFVAPQVELGNILPVFPIDYKKITKASLAFVGFPFLELSTFLVLQPYVKEKEQLKKAFVIGTFLGGAALIAITLQCIFVLGSDLTSIYLYPSYELAKKIHVAEVLERVEAILAILWFTTVFFKIVLTFFASVIVLSDMLKLKSYQQLILPLGIFVLIYSITMTPNITYVWFSAKVWPFYSFISGFVFPILLIIGSRIKKQKSQNTS
ncbi:endospore germination permease [Microbacteriaceae bacterium 4G12]